MNPWRKLHCVLAEDLVRLGVRDGLAYIQDFVCKQGLLPAFEYIVEMQKRTITYLKGFLQVYGLYLNVRLSSSVFHTFLEEVLTKATGAYKLNCWRGLEVSQIPKPQSPNAEPQNPLHSTHLKPLMRKP